MSYFDKHDYIKAIAEHISPHSYATHTYYKPAGYPAGIYRVNTLAMLNTCEKMQTPLADAALKEFKSTLGTPSHHTFAYHWARLIEAVEALELIKTYLEDKDICGTDIKVDVTAKAGEGVGLTEAPRGILLYHITSDADGICTKLNLLVATNHNVAGIEKSVEQVAKAVLEGNLLKSIKLPTPMLK
jgi:F420-non-reducing hydrogenase large subunit